MANINSLADQQVGNTASTTLDWLSLIDAPRLILGTGKNDLLSAQATWRYFKGLDGNDKLSSAFNQTALIGGESNDA